MPSIQNNISGVNPRGPIGTDTLHGISAHASPAVPDNSGSLTFPTAKEVENFHRNSDADKRPESIHHSLGQSHNQGAYGDHNHQGGNSAQLIDPIAGLFTQNLGTPQGQKDAIKQLITLLTSLGATDGTTVSGSYPEIRTGTLAVSWTAAGQFSDDTPLTFSPVMTGVPKLVMTCRSTSATLQYIPQQHAGLSVSGTTVRVWTTASNTAGASVPVDWIAIFMKAYT